MPFGIGVWELAILLLVALLVFGPKKLPEMGKQLGRGMREFKQSISGNDEDDRDEDRSLPRTAPEARQAPEDETRMAESADDDETRVPAAAGESQTKV